ncbi:MAG: outer membrane beta-barrel protein [Lentimicrobiaceae bacterium]|nr:outer membrane beta-barrel protein [Lentimicrobiaceae bacterium]
MKKLLISFVLILSITVLKAQNTSDLFTEKYTSGFDIFTDIIMDAPDGIDFRAFSPGVNIYGMRTFPVKESNFAFAVGLGLGIHNIFSNAVLNDTMGVSYFTPIPDKAASGGKLSYKKSKLTLTYLDLPAEIRFKSAAGFRVALGVKVGLLVDAHTKYKGDDLITGKKTKLKQGYVPHIATWRFGPTVQIGYKWINLIGYYSVTKIFDENAGPEIYPISIGLALRPF